MLQQKSQNRAPAPRAILVAVMISVVAFLRIAPHPWNFTPIGAMALFSGAMFRDRRVALLFPLMALLAGDFLTGMHRLIPVVYASFLLEVLIGTWLGQRHSVPRIGVAVVFGALEFFLITNFAIWKVFDTYPHTLVGLGACYLAGLPLFVNTLAGDAFYAAVLFGSFAFVQRLQPTLREPISHAAVRP
jgi:hypothetical protein